MAKNSLRAEAEKLLSLKEAANDQIHTDDNILHELHVHQIELEMQNEDLIRAYAELEKSRDSYVDFYDFAPVGYLTLNDSCMIDAINLTGAALLGVERRKLVHRRFASFVTPYNQDKWYRHFQDVLTHDGTLTCEMELLRRDGSCFYAQLDCLCLRKAGENTVVRIVLTDINARKLAEEETRNQKDFFHMLAENVEDFIAVLDLEGKRLYNSPSYARLFGNSDTLKGTDSFRDIHPEDRERVKQAFMATIKSGIGLRTEFRFVLPNSDIRYMESCGGLISNSNGEPLRVVVVSRDITDRIKNEKEIRNLAFYDCLTQLPNRRLLDDRLEKAIAASKRSGNYGAVLFLDLDNFKPLNDTHGHRAGDMLLIEVAQRLIRCVREVDTVARFGGDEFVVVLSELDAVESECAVQSTLIAEKIRAALEEPFWLTYNSKGTSKMIVHHHCRASIGVVLFGGNTSTDKILKWADKAMYQAKQAGRNLIRFHDTKE